jgi:hypothetical protein
MIVTNNCDIDTRFEISDTEESPYQKSYNNSCLELKKTLFSIKF